MFSTGVITCQRKVSYLNQTLRSIRAAGFGEIHVYADGNPLPLMTTTRCNNVVWQTNHTAVRLGPKPTFKQLLWILAHHDEPWIVIFEDDVQVARGLRGWLEENIPQEGVVSLYTSSAHDGDDGWQQVHLTPSPDQPWPWRNCLGACALAMRQETALDYLANDPQQERTDRGGASLGEYCYRNDLPFWVHNPSLVQHVGEVSAFRDSFPFTDQRRAARFCEDVEQLQVTT